MREIKFSCMWHDGKSWMDLRYTLEEMENGDHWEALADQPMLKKFKLKHRRQFTGLQDKNGTDIYEGDIVSVECYGEFSRWEVIGPTEDYPAFELKGWDGESNGLSHCMCAEGFGIEVIGNIHETPELLEKIDEN